MEKRDVILQWRDPVVHPKPADFVSWHRKHLNFVPCCGILFTATAYPTSGWAAHLSVKSNRYLRRWLADLTTIFPLSLQCCPTSVTRNLLHLSLLIHSKSLASPVFESSWSTAINIPSWHRYVDDLCFYFSRSCLSWILHLALEHSACCPWKYALSALLLLLIFKFLYLHWIGSEPLVCPWFIDSTAIALSLFISTGRHIKQHKYHCAGVHMTTVEHSSRISHVDLAKEFTFNYTAFFLGPLILSWNIWPG